MRWLKTFGLCFGLSLSSACYGSHAFAEPNVDGAPRLVAEGGRARLWRHTWPRLGRLPASWTIALAGGFY